MKKKLKIENLILAMSLVFLITLTACNNSTKMEEINGSKKVVTIWTSGSENVKNTWTKLAELFNSNTDYNEGQYEMKVEHISSGTGATSLMDRLIAQFKAGEENTTYDIVEINGGEYATYLSEGGEDIFIQLDKNKISNYSKMEANLGEGEEHLLPYRGTTVVLAYNSELVSNPPKTADEMYKWIKDNPGQYAYNTPGSGGSGSAFVRTAIYNFLPEEALTSSDEKWMKEWDKGFQLMEELHPSLYQSGGKTIYPHKNQGSLDLLINKQISMTPAWVDMIISQINQGTMPETIRMTQINPAFTGELVTLAIPSTSKQFEGAHAVLNFVISDEAQMVLLDEMGAFPVIDMAGFDSKNAEMLSSFSIESFRSSDLGNLNAEIVKRWDENIATLP